MYWEIGPTAAEWTQNMFLGIFSWIKCIFRHLEYFCTQIGLTPPSFLGYGPKIVQIVKISFFRIIIIV